MQKKYKSNNKADAVGFAKVRRRSSKENIKLVRERSATEKVGNIRRIN